MLNNIIVEDITKIIENNRELLKKLEGTRLLISGGGGFLGSYFLDVIDMCNKTLFKDPCKVICVENFITGIPDRIRHLENNSHIQILNQDITKPIVFDERIDYIIHCAGIASPTFYRKYPIETIEVNVTGAKNLLELAKTKNVKSFLYFSTSEIYGNPLSEYIPTPETYNGNVSCTGPRACYDESKRLGETLCVSYYTKHNVPVKVVRPFNVYGPGLRLDDKRVIPDYFMDGFMKKKICIFSDGNPTRSFCYVSDAIDGFLKAFLSDYNGEAFNIGNDEQEISMGELAKLVANSIGNVQIEYQQSLEQNYLTDNPQRRCPDLSKSKGSLGYNPKVSLEEGLQRLKQWYQDSYGLTP